MKTNDAPTRNADVDEWRRCGGEVGQVVHRLRTRRRVARIRTASLFVLLAIVALSGGYIRSSLTTQFTNEVTGSPCATYSEEIRAFYCDKTQSELEPRLWEHIAHCSDCGRDFMFFGGISHTHARAAKRHNGQVLDHPVSSTTASLDKFLSDTTLAVRP